MSNTHKPSPKILYIGSITDKHREAIACAQGVPFPSSNMLTTMVESLEGFDDLVRILDAQPADTFVYLNSATACRACILYAGFSRLAFGFFEKGFNNKLRLYHVSHFRIELVWTEDKGKEPDKRLKAHAA